MSNIALLIQFTYKIDEFVSKILIVLPGLVQNSLRAHGGKRTIVPRFINATVAVKIDLALRFSNHLLTSSYSRSS